MKILLLLGTVLLGHSPSFEKMMGEGTPSWQHVATAEDRDNLRFYQTLYEKNHQPKPLSTIPKIAHIIWLGPQEFPQESIPHIKTWIAHHPDWKIHFWTDLDREAPCLGMLTQNARTFPFLKLSECYDKAENFGEKSLVLRYEILFQQGGLYLDHDAQPLPILDTLHTAYDFYAELEPLKPSMLSSSIYPAVHTLAAKPHHPIIDSTITWLQQHWDTLETHYPGSDPSSLVNRVHHRSIAALNMGVQAQIDQTDNRDILFPAGTLAKHTHAGTWFKTKTALEQKIEHLLEEMEHKSSLATILIISLAALNLAALLFFYRNQKRRPS